MFLLPMIRAALGACRDIYGRSCGGLKPLRRLEPAGSPFCRGCAALWRDRSAAASSDSLPLAKNSFTAGKEVLALAAMSLLSFCIGGLWGWVGFFPPCLFDFLTCKHLTPPEQKKQSSHILEDTSGTERTPELRGNGEEQGLQGLTGMSSFSRKEPASEKLREAGQGPSTRIAQ